MALEVAVYPFPWTRGNFVDSLAAGYFASLLHGTGGELLAYCVAMAGVDEMHLLNITVAPAARRQGHARRLLGELEAAARRLGAWHVWLEVRESNGEARRAYQRLGFAHVGVRRGYYPAPAGREDAVVMSRPVDGAGGDRCAGVSASGRCCARWASSSGRASLAARPRSRRRPCRPRRRRPGRRQRLGHRSSRPPRRGRAGLGRWSRPPRPKRPPTWSRPTGWSSATPAMLALATPGLPTTASSGSSSSFSTACCVRSASPVPRRPRERRACFASAPAASGAVEAASIAERERLLGRVAPRLVLALGRGAARLVLDSDEPLGRLRGRVHAVAGVPVVVSFALAYLLRHPHEKAKAWEDLCLAVRALEDASVQSAGPGP